MGKFHKNKNNGGNRHHNQNNNNNGGGNGGKWCKNCKMSNHNTQDCTKKNQISPQNQNNRVDKKNKNKNKNNRNENNNGNERNSNSNNNNNQREKGRCTRCGWTGHNQSNCKATALPEDQQCPCQCEFHKPHQCPWNNDYLEREAAVQQATGKLCQWCKDSGDGMHVYEDCKEPRKFKNQLLDRILRSYDDIKWCWHCSSVNHMTRSCSATSADEEKTKWNAKIVDLISEWRNYDASTYDMRQYDDEQDVAMYTARKQMKPPLAADFKWCILCEEFGHWADNGITGADCKRDEYEKKCPPQFKNQAVATKQSFVPAAFQNNARATPGAFGGNSSFRNRCMFPDCNAMLGPWFIPVPPKGQSIVCPKCHRANEHPANPRRDSKIELLELALKYLSGQKVEAKKSKKRALLDEIKNEYKKRPSLALSKKLAVHKWPEHQPQYTDLSSHTNKSPVFASTHRFNDWGNWQTYFPAVKFRIDEDMEAIALNDELPINKAGRLGLQHLCLNCGVRARVSDDEGDAVMCGNDGMCTVGCGIGVVSWEGGRNLCDCLPIAGRSYELGWVVPRR